MSVQKISRTTNAEVLKAAVDEACSRDEGLPGVVVMYGFSGVGKSQAIAYCAVDKRGYHVECRDTWTRKAFLQAILAEMGIAPARTLSDMVAQVGAQLTTSKRPLFVDDVQYLLDRDAANVLTDIHNASSGGTLVLVGEERVPVSLGKLERLHNRVLTWVPAAQGSLSDLKTLAKDRYPAVVFEDALLKSICEATKGCLRRAVVNLSKVNKFAVEMGLQTIGMEQWGKKGWDSGKAPGREKEAANG